jgi:DNA-binding beta-propeller fold protein YncE
MPLVFARSILGFGVVAGPPAPTWTDPDLANASYDSVSFDVSSQQAGPTNIGFNDDGTSMYIIGSATDAIHQYTLSTAWNLSTASYASKIFNISDNVPRDFTFNNNGTKLYYVGSSGDTVFQYSLSTAYDISTASTDNKSLSVASQAGTPTGIEFKSDGTKLYVCDGGTDAIYQYSLSTAFDVSTGSYDSVSFSFSSQGTNTQSIFFSPDGTSLFVCDTAGSNDTVYKYSLSTAWDVSTLSYANESFSLAGQDDPFGVAFKSDGSKMYMVGLNNQIVYQYSTVAAAWTNPDIANASYDTKFYAPTTQDTAPSSFFISSDGTKLYVAGNTTDRVYQYTLSTAWDISTASYDSVSLSISGQQNVPFGIEFKSDGTKMYITGNTNDEVNQYALTTAWDLSTASFETGKTLSVSSEETSPTDIQFNTDGTIALIIGRDSDKVHKYNLSTAWDITTASKTTGQEFSVASQEGFPYGMRLSPNDDKIWILGFAQNTVFQYSVDLSDLTNSSYDSVSKSVSAQSSSSYSLFFKDDGSKMYVLDSISDTIYQYST